MESVIWAFKQLYDKGCVYEGFRVLPYCWNDETPLSNHELRMDDDVYQMRQDPAVTVGMRLTSGPAEGALAAVWTTTPWTLPSNLAVDGRRRTSTTSWSSPTPPATAERYLLAEARLAAYAREFGDDAARSWRGSPARTWSAAPTRRRSPTTSAASTRSAWCRRRVRHHHRRHRAGAHRRRLR